MMPTQLYIQRLNQLFARHRLDLIVTDSDIHVLGQVVTDALKGRRISTRLTEAISPPIHKGEFYHYTRGHAADKILKCGVLRLTTIKKRIGEAEIVDFLKKFGLSYPLLEEPGKSMPRYNDTLANELFYTSFTDTTLSTTEEAYFWEEFAGHDGVRLKFSITLKSGCLRRMVYDSQIDKWASLFREISSVTEAMLNRVFFWDDAATVCALYLPKPYDIEKEARLITRRKCGLTLGTESGFEYLEARIGWNGAILLDLNLIEVQTDRAVSNARGAIVIPRK